MAVAPDRVRPADAASGRSVGPPEDDGSARGSGWPAFGLALAIALLNLLLWAALNRPVHPPEWTGPIHGFAFSAYQRDQSPLDQTFPSDAEIDSDLTLLATATDRVRSYTSSEKPALPALAAKHGLKLTAGAWLDRRRDNNRRELDALIAQARQYDGIERVIVGNEAVLRGDLTPARIGRYLDEARAALDKPVSTAEPWHVWLKYPELADHVDYITIHLLPYWEGVRRDRAVGDVLHKYELVRKRFPGKPVVIGEVGWPTDGDRFRASNASTSDAALFIREFLRVADERKLDYYVMEAFDQPWKEATGGRVEAYWGMYDADRTPKYPLTGPVEEDAAWWIKAIAASALALLPMLGWARRFRRFALCGRLFFLVLLQAGASTVVWSLSLPLEFYLGPADWAAYAVLVPAQLAMLSILYILGFEFVEALAQPDWRRRFHPLGALPARPPKVSIHVACHNEPPEMVIQTLDSLAALDYPDFEVLVIDNNTADEAVWRPVEAHCTALGPRFRFFHLLPWPGFKAGALNFGLDQTPPEAGVIAVIDSDYVVEPNWLKELVGHFDDPKVGVVQAPQAHREFEGNPFRRMTNWEYEGFFRIGMHHRNERDAIIQHGTMTMIRAGLLKRLRWSEWCICEDAELGLRVMEEGFTTVYVDEVYGRGVTPADFAAFKSQRFRWAFGAMQILRAHLGELLAGYRLSPGQRYHFLTGWFGWFADALHLGFSLLAVGWTLGLLWLPGWFSLPHALFLVPVIGFFVAKSAFGIVLYRRLVPCGWRDAWGAALASMALSHAIARGVLRGMVAREHPFTRTAKKRRLRKQPGPIHAVREEFGLLLALGLGAIAIGFAAGGGEPEARLWQVVLVAQALPYAAALAMAWIAARSGERGG